MQNQRGETSRDVGLGLHSLRLGHLRFEKCELREAERAFLEAWDHARSLSDPRLGAEVLVGLLRFAGEAKDNAATQKWESSLDSLIEEFPENISPLVWYAKGALSLHQGKWLKAQRLFHLFLRTARSDKIISESDRILFEARALSMLANTQQHRGARQRAALMASFICF
jgi:hypothetical protein